MPRLIDAEIKVNVKLFDIEREVYITREKTVEEVLDTYAEGGCPPTVDAIPIEWMDGEKMNYDDLLRELKMEVVSFPDISAEDLADIIHALENHFCNATKDAVPVRHGRWVEHHEPYTWMGYTYWSCPKCGFECGCDKDISHRTNYCPNCGAKMDEVCDEHI